MKRKIAADLTLVPCSKWSSKGMGDVVLQLSHDTVVKEVRLKRRRLSFSCDDINAARGCADNEGQVPESSSNQAIEVWAGHENGSALRFETIKCDKEDGEHNRGSLIGEIGDGDGVVFCAPSGEGESCTYIQVKTPSMDRFDVEVWGIANPDEADEATTPPTLIAPPVHRPRTRSQGRCDDEARQFYTTLLENSKRGVLITKPMLDLYYYLVRIGDFQEAEKCISSLGDGGGGVHVDSSMKRIRVQWNRILCERGEGETSDDEISSSQHWPSSRAGHQMVFDPKSNSLLMFGGWNGYNDLADMWRFDVATTQWQLIEKDTKAIGGPSARSCHKMVLDEVNRKLYLLGMFHSFPIAHNLTQFWCYDIQHNQWDLLNQDTASVGGPGMNSSCRYHTKIPMLFSLSRRCV